MDAFILSLRDLCTQLIPILTATCLVCVIILLIKIIKAVSSLDTTLLKTHETIDLVDRSIEKVQSPLDTAVKVSDTVDKAHDATVDAVVAAKDFLSRNAGDIKEKISTIISSEKTETVDELKEPSPEDLIGD